MSNMELWDSVCKTDPNHTKKVNQRGGFTAIDAHYQIQQATEAFGPIGKGWGFETGQPIFQNSAVIVPVTLWHGDRSNAYGPIYGCSEMFGKRVDTDAPKKATTDGITKALSMLGFNADVFLGKFDDNKYVKEVAGDIEKEKLFKHLTDKYGNTIDAIVDGIAEGNLGAASEAWAELTNEEKQELWVAPTKGGVFTTKEREVMKSTEFREAREAK